jgi:hypothetical protein
VDVIEGRGPSPFFVLLLLQRLPDDSLTTALRLGGYQFFGWNTTRHLLADLYDAMNLNTRATGTWKNGKAPKIPEFPRPKKSADKAAPKPKVSVKDLYARMQKGV